MERKITHKRGVKKKVGENTEEKRKGTQAERKNLG